MDCSVAAIVFGTIYAYDAAKFPNGGPTTMADLFGVDPDNAVHVDVLIRTFVVSTSVTLMYLLLGYPLAPLIAPSSGVVANMLLLLGRP